MSSVQLSRADFINQRIADFCTEAVPFLKEYEVLENLRKHNRYIKSIRQARAFFSVSSHLPSLEELSAAAKIYKAAIPTLEHAVARLERCNKNLAKVQNGFGTDTDFFPAGIPEHKSQILGAVHAERDCCLQLFGLAGLMGSLMNDIDRDLIYLGRCLEDAKADNIGTLEWVGAISGYCRKKARDKTLYEMKA